MKSKYKKAVRHELERTKSLKPELLTEADMEHLPEIVKKYIRFSGFIGKEKILNFRLECKGGIRFKPDEEYMPLKSVQYNFMDLHSRLFYIVAKKKGIPAIGLHLYQNAKAVFKIKILGLFTVVNAKGPRMDQGETVTVLNDMFFMAPESLIDKSIRWEIIDSLSVKAIFSNDNISVSAVIYFNDEGRLTNFISNDRFDTDGKEYKSYPWETPVTEYREFNGYKLPSKAKLIYKRPEGDFCYAEFELLSIEYNCKEFR
jgi:hypothetical protein